MPFLQELRTHLADMRGHFRVVRNFGALLKTDVAEDIAEDVGADDDGEGWKRGRDE